MNLTIRRACYIVGVAAQHVSANFSHFPYMFMNSMPKTLRLSHAPQALSKMLPPMIDLSKATSVDTEWKEIFE